jgi:hypothetical protein
MGFIVGGEWSRQKYESLQQEPGAGDKRMAIPLHLSGYVVVGKAQTSKWGKNWVAILEAG